MRVFPSTRPKKNYHSSPFTFTFAGDMHARALCSLWKRAAKTHADGERLGQLQSITTSMPIHLWDQRGFPPMKGSCDSNVKCLVDIMRPGHRTAFHTAWLRFAVALNVKDSPFWDFAQALLSILLHQYSFSGRKLSQCIWVLSQVSCRLKQGTL